MKRTALIVALSSFAAIASAQTANTNCYQYGNAVNCQTQYTSPPPQFQMPDIAGSFQRGREARLRQEQMEIQTELLRQQLQANTQTAPSESPSDIDQQLLRDANERRLAQERKRREDEEQWINVQTMFTQIEACVSLSKGNKQEEKDCIDRLKLTDPTFARTWAESHGSRKPTPEQ